MWTLASLLRMARAQGSSLAQGSALAARVPGPSYREHRLPLAPPGWYRAAGHAYNCSAAASAAQQGGTAPAIGLGGGGRCDAGALGLLDLLLAAQPVLAVLGCWLGTLTLSGLLLRPRVAPHTQYTP